MSTAPEDTNNNRDNADSLLAEIEKRITDAFDIFDHESNKTVDVREVGTIIRSLNCCPSEAELHDMLAEIEEEEPTGYIRFEKFLIMMRKVLMERRYKPSPEDQILKAFQVLDTDGKGHLTAEELTKYMTEEGEKLTGDETLNMRVHGHPTDPKHNIFLYTHFCKEVVQHNGSLFQTVSDIVWRDVCVREARRKEYKESFSSSKSSKGKKKK